MVEININDDVRIMSDKIAAIIKQREKEIFTEIHNRVIEDYHKFKDLGYDTKGHFRCLVFVDEYAKELGVDLFE
ncbi:MAG: hypothetical protein WC516_06425 [Patescibacteria group bacterium]|jgi:hypothetical protein